MLHEESIEPKTLDLLRQLANLAELKDFALVGGTGLALQLGHRKSVDLDFFSRGEFSVEALIEVLESNFDLSVTGREAFSLNCRINDVKVDFLRHRYALLSEIVLVEGIPIWSVEDIAAAKISAITNRGAKKDFYDLVEILKKRSLDSVLALYEKKYPSGDRFLAMKSLNWFEDADEEPDPMTLAGNSWTEVKDSVLTALKGISA